MTRQEWLRELNLDRDEPPVDKTRRRRWWWLAGASLVTVAAIGIGVLLLMYVRPPTVTAAVVRAWRASPGAGNGSSLLDVSGYVVAHRQATVSAKVTGKLVALMVEEGRHIDADEIVAKLDDTNAVAALTEAKAAVTQALSAVAQAKAAFDDIAPVFHRNQSLAVAGIISAEALDTSRSNYDARRSELAVARGALEVRRAAQAVAQRGVIDTVVRAPFAGVVTTTNAQPGEIVSPLSAGGGFTRTGICTLVDMNSLEVDIDVNEGYIGRIHAGQPAVLDLNAYPDWRIPAHVIAVVPTADRAKATVKVRVGFEERDPRILPEMGARVSFLEGTVAAVGAGIASAPMVPAVVVPAVALLRPVGTADPRTAVVFVLHDDMLERRAVRLGAEDGNAQVVLSGVQPGERVAVGDLSRLADGLRVRVSGPWSEADGKPGNLP